jgi:hypothetical protein
MGSLVPDFVVMLILPPLARLSLALGGGLNAELLH